MLRSRLLRSFHARTGALVLAPGALLLDPSGSCCPLGRIGGAWPGLAVERRGTRCGDGERWPEAERLPKALLITRAPWWCKELRAPIGERFSAGISAIDGFMGWPGPGQSPPRTWDFHREGYLGCKSSVIYNSVQTCIPARQMVKCGNA